MKIPLLALLLLSCNCVIAQEDYMKTLITTLGIRESAVASRDMPGWERPKKILFEHRPFEKEGPGSKAWVEEITDGIPIEFVRNNKALDYDQVDDYDVFVGWCDQQLIRSASELDYINIMSAGIERCSNVPDIGSYGLIATNGAKGSSETIAEHSIALLLSLSRGIKQYLEIQEKGKWSRASIPKTVALKGKTMLVLGLGGIGTQVAKRAYGLGMRVIGTRNSSRSGPDFVSYVGLSDEMLKLAGEADVVVNTLPLTGKTSGVVGEEFFDRLKSGAFYITVGRGKTTDTDALIKALKNGKLAGAGLDVTDPEPLTDGHELWTMENVIITQHTASRSDLTVRNTLYIARENLRRYIRGEKLLNMVDLERGY